jgi:AhpD family alkylhydroperoxidase
LGREDRFHRYDLAMLVRALTEMDAPLLAKPFYGGGDPGPITATMAHVPELLEIGLPFIGAALAPSAIPFRTKEIVILRTSAMLACRYCIDSHTPVALDSGLSHDQVRALRNEPGTSTNAAFPDDADRAVIAWIDEVAAGRGPIKAEVNQLTVKNFAEHEIVELTLTITVTMLLNRYATSLQLPVSEGTLTRLTAEGFTHS